MGSTTGWNADAESAQTIIEDGKIVFQIVANSHIAVGLTTGNDSRANTDLDYGIQVAAGSRTASAIRPEGTNVAIGEYSSETVFAIQRVGGQVRYLKDDVVVYTSTQPSSGTLRVDCSFYTAASQLTRTRIYTGDLDEDGLPDAWELKYLPQVANYDDLEAFTPGGDADADALTNLQEYKDGSNPTQNLNYSGSINVDWTPSSTTNVQETVNGGVKKIAGTAAWSNADAVATKTVFDTGRLNFQVKAGSYLAVGFTVSDDSRSYTDLEYGIRVDSAGDAAVFEGSANKANLGEYDANTRFALRRVGSQVEYLKNGVVFYTSTVPAYGVLYVDCALRNVGSEVLSAQLYTGDLDEDYMADDWELHHLSRLYPGSPLSYENLEDDFLMLDDLDADGVSNLLEYRLGTDPLQGLSELHPITWTSLVNTSLVGSNGGLQKTSGAAGYNADAVSMESFTGDRTLFFYASPTGSMAVGLTYANNSRAATDLEYAFLLTASGAKIQRPETSTDLDVGDYSSGTQFGIRHQGNQIEFLKDGVIVYTSTTLTTANLYADCSISSVNHSIGSAYFFDADIDNDGLPDAWEFQSLSLYASLTDLEDLTSEDDGPDNDGVTLWDEYFHGTSPLLADTDGDGMPDGWEIAYGLDPLDPRNASTDADGDGINNLLEYLHDLDPHHIDPGGEDSDGDGLIYLVEMMLGTDPNHEDSDGDEVIDSSDAYPINAMLQTEPVANPLDTLAPLIALDEPLDAQLLP